MSAAWLHDNNNNNSYRFRVPHQVCCEAFSFLFPKTDNLPLLSRLIDLSCGLQHDVLCACLVSVY